MHLAEQCRRQAGWCAQLGSPLYAYLLEHVAQDVEDQGPAWRLLTAHAADAPSSAVPLRLMGAVHRLVLTGAAPELGRCYPSMGGSGDASAAWKPFRALLDSHAAELASLLLRPVQTNDVGRSGSLLGGFLCSAQLFRKPLRLLEIGTSAGLNLCWDQYRYDWEGGAGWGPVDAAVRLGQVFRNTPPKWPREVAIAERSGCDLHPLDAGSAEGRLTLRSYVWADQQERLARLDAACAIAERLPLTLERESAGTWLEGKLARPVHGVVTVVFHSVMWQYLSAEEKAKVATVIVGAGRQASPTCPLVWLRLEPRNEDGSGGAVLQWQGFPNGEQRVLATSGFHAPAVLWSGDLEGFDTLVERLTGE